MNFTGQQLVWVGERYYGNMFEIMSTDRVEALITREADALPENGIPRGHAASMGVVVLLQSPNLYPVGKNSTNIRLAITCFDRQLARVNNTERQFQFQRELFVRYYHIVHKHIEDPQLAGHDTLGVHKDVKGTFRTTKMWIVALLVSKLAYGWHVKASHMDKLWAMGELPENKLVHYMFVLPCVQLACTEMNPHNSLCYRTILNYNLKRLENNIKSKSRQFGWYSQNEAIRRINLDPAVHPNEAITYRDEQMCCGIEYQFARMFSLIIKDFKWPFNTSTKQPEKLWITPQEKARAYVGYSADVCARYGRPSYV